MKIVSSLLQGGLGNQLFQISAALSLSKELNIDTAFNLSSCLFNIQNNKIKKYQDNIFSKLSLTEDKKIFNNLTIYNEPGFYYVKLPLQSNLLLNGYFQSEKYFILNKNYIQQIFSENSNVKIYINKKYSHINFKESVSIHVRRGDYLKFPDIHPVCTKEYYNNSLKLINNYKNLLIFSDDIEWCKENLKYDNCVYITGEEDFIDMYIMARCRDNIIANSSFSWWGSWLNNNPDKIVVAPSKWFGKNGPKHFEDLYYGNVKCIE